MIPRWATLLFILDSYIFWSLNHTEQARGQWKLSLLCNNRSEAELPGREHRRGKPGQLHLGHLHGHHTRPPCWLHHWWCGGHPRFHPWGEKYWILTILTHSFPQPIWTLLGCLMFLASGIMVIMTWSSEDYVSTSSSATELEYTRNSQAAMGLGALCIITSLIFLTDFIWVGCFFFSSLGSNFVSSFSLINNISCIVWLSGRKIKPNEMSNQICQDTWFG